MKNLSSLYLLFAISFFSSLSFCMNTPLLLEHSCFLGESLKFQNDFFSSNYKNLPERQLKVYEKILGSMINESKIQLFGVFPYHSYYRKNCLMLIEEQNKYCIDVKLSKIVGYKALMPIQNPGAESNKYCISVLKSLINFISKNVPPNRTMVGHELIKAILSTQDNCSTFNHNMHDEMLRALQINDYHFIIYLSDVSREMKCNSINFDDLKSKRAKELKLL